MAGFPDRYSGDVLADAAARRRESTPQVAAERGLIIEIPGTSFVGELVAIHKDGFTLENRDGKRRIFDWASAKVAVEGRLVQIVPAAKLPPTAHQIRSASGSTYVRDHAARVARSSRIVVEGKHDAELVEKVWGHDLRVDGVVVELLDGADNLPLVVADYAATRRNRLGVLLDHLTLGSKESRIADQVRGQHVLVTGHPFIDIWQAIKPSVAGIEAWPVIPRGQEWKVGVCAALGWPDPPQAWQILLSRVHSWTDLEPALIAAVEALIDFVTDVPELTS